MEVHDEFYQENTVEVVVVFVVLMFMLINSFYKSKISKGFDKPISRALESSSFGRPWQSFTS